MARIAILGGSYRAALIDWRNENFDINDYKDNNEFHYNISKDNNKILNREDHWINLLSESILNTNFMYMLVREQAGKYIKWF